MHGGPVSAEGDSVEDRLFRIVECQGLMILAAPQS
jgi:hypothetical protein